MFIPTFSRSNAFRPQVPTNAVVAAATALWNAAWAMTFTLASSRMTRPWPAAAPGACAQASSSLYRAIAYTTCNESCPPVRSLENHNYGHSQERLRGQHLAHAPFHVALSGRPQAEVHDALRACANTPRVDCRGLRLPRRP
eukprot:5256929-Amphidinium_carterae.1